MISFTPAGTNSKPRLRSPYAFENYNIRLAIGQQIAQETLGRDPDSSEEVWIDSPHLCASESVTGTGLERQLRDL